MYWQSGKNLLSSNISSRCPHNMENFGPLAAEIGPVVWGAPANFNEFRILAALLHGTPAVGVSRTLRCWAPIFDRAAITLGIGPHSSLLLLFYVHNCTIYMLSFTLSKLRRPLCQRLINTKRNGWTFLAWSYLAPSKFENAQVARPSTW